MGKGITDRAEFKRVLARRDRRLTTNYDSSTPGGHWAIPYSTSDGSLILEGYFSDYTFPDAPNVSKALIDPQSATFKNIKRVQIKVESDERNGVVFYGFRNKVFPEITVTQWVGIKFTFSQAKITDAFVVGTSIKVNVEFEAYSVELV